MKKFGLLSSSAMGSAALFGLSLAFAAPAYAQDDPAPPATASDQDQADDQGGQNVEVTGTRIRRPNIESNVPIVSVTADEIADGDPSVGDALNDLPSLRSTFSQANSVRFIGTTGLNILDLRGLGTARTLVLVNGRRHITASPGDYLVDVNTIPSDLIERIDVITGGSSAVYGSDAIAGVVNFVLRQDYDGIRLRGQGGISQQGDRGIQFVSLTAGRNFADDRANVAINLEYVNAEALYFGDRPILTGAYDGRCQVNLAEFTAGEPQAGDGVPDQLFFCGVRNASISNGGTVPGNATAAQCQSAAFGPLGASAALGAARCLNPGTPLGQPRLFRFNELGQLLQDVPCFDFRPFASGNIISCPTSTVPGATLRNTGQIAPGLDRYTANILFHFDISEAFRPFFEGKYVHIFSRQQGQPSFFGPVSGTFGLPASFNQRCDNAFLDAADIATLRSIGECETAGGAFNPADTFPLQRFNTDFGGRAELVTRDTYRFVAGIRGDFNEDWNYEISFNYGHVDIHQDELNDLILTDINGNFDGFFLAYDSVLVNGVPTCRVNADADPTNDSAACVPVDLFGQGRPSAAAIDFMTTTSFVDQEASEYNVVAYVNGDLSQLFELPGGPIRFVVGGEYRRETAFLEADPLSAAGGTFFNAFATFDPPALEVWEAFGEVEIPLLRDLPFAQELTLTAAGRYSDYNDAAGTAGSTFSYNINGTWAPVRDIRFRANYSKSVRVPTLTDLFTVASQNFAFIQDPCDVVNIGNGTANRGPNCAADGIPVGFINTPARTQSTGFFSQGNPFLTEETGKSLTVGTVITPRWVPGLSITVDYYRIRVDNLIAVLGAQVILNQCYDLPRPNQFCTLLFPRNADFTFQNPALISGGVNFAKFAADGIDMELSYRRTFENGHRLNLRAIATYVIRRDNFTSPTDPTFRDRILSELGDPQWSANLNISYGIGPWDLRWSMNYIGKQVIATPAQGGYETAFGIDGRPPQNADLNSPIYYPDVLYHAVRLSYRVNERFQFYAGIDNVFDTDPRLFRNTFGSTGSAGGSAYDYIGRYFYAGAIVDF
ncbi:MAG TPA: TonB-dependent receptor [Allosphingosinicella sp.]|nr:TonB-dependent receptor [Allosphingosinicella sp.]